MAFTIELDNEFEHQMVATSPTGSGAGVWLTSMAMWSTCMRFVGPEGVTVAGLEARARTPTNLNGMARWGYVVVEPDPADPRPKPPRSAWTVRATAAGRRAQEVWAPLLDAIEARWWQRFDSQELDRLRDGLGAMARHIDPGLPDCLPILRYGLVSAPESLGLRSPVVTEPADPAAVDNSLPVLLSRVLLALAVEFERRSEVSLAISADILRVVDRRGVGGGDGGAGGVRVKDLPRRGGVSKESVSMAIGFLEKRGLATVATDPNAARGKVLRLTPKGRKARDAYRQVASGIEDEWSARVGEPTVANLRRHLEGLVGDGGAGDSPLFRGLEPYPDGWRASVTPPTVLPHFPMVLHRGGFPDGS